MQIKRHLTPFIFGLLIFAVSFPAINALAQQPQEATLSITPGDTYTRFNPENFSIGPIFIDPAVTETKVYKTLAPGLTEADITLANVVSQTILNQYVVEDAQGIKFDTVIHFSNLVDGNKVIPFEQISMVTIANHPTGLDSFNTASPPANTVGIIAPVACLGWNNNIEANCQTEFNMNNFAASPTDPADHASDPLNDIDENATIINVNPAKAYSLNGVIKFTDGEKAFVTAKAPDNSTITVRRGILGTNATAHTAGSGIICNGYSSQPVTIIEAAEQAGRIGSYSVGFGFLLTIINSTFEPGNYSGNITFDLYPDPSP